MSEDNFIEGSIVEYEQFTGKICFVSSSYISLCISETVQEENIHRTCQCRLVIFPENWHKIKEISK